MVDQDNLHSGFVNGTISRYARGDIANPRFKQGVADSLNYLCRPEGGMQRRPGTLDFASNSIDTRLINFNTGYIIGLQPNSDIKIYDALSGAVVQTLTHTWTNTQVHQLSIQQVVNSLIFTVSNHKQKELARNPSTGVWTFADFDVKDGPYEPQNFSRDKRIKIDHAITGTVTEGHTKYGVLKITGVDSDNNNGNFFSNTSEWVGRTLRFRSKTSYFERWVVLENLQYVSNNEMTGTARKEYGLIVDGALPYGPTRNWQLSSWSASLGYPEVIGLDNNRLWFLDSTRRHGSVAGGLDTFSPSLPVADDTSYVVSDDCAIDVYSNNPVSSQPVWAVPSGIGSLLVGTDQGVEEIYGYNGAITPSTVSIRPQSFIGASKIKPVLLDDLYYVDKTRTQIIKLGYQWTKSRNTAKPINILNVDMFDDRIVDMVVVRNPFLMIWVALENGDFVIGTIDVDNDKYAWTRHRLAGGTKIRYFVVQDGKTVFAQAGSRILKFGELTAFKGRKLQQLLHTNSAPYQSVVLETPLELYTDNSTVYAAGTLALNTVPINTSVAVDLTNYTNYTYKANGSEAIANGYSIGLAFEAYIVFNDVVNSSGTQSDFFLYKKVKELLVAMVDTGDFKISQEGGIKAVSDRVKYDFKTRDASVALPVGSNVVSGRFKLTIGAAVNKAEINQLRLEPTYSQPSCITGVCFIYEAAPPRG